MSETLYLVKVPLQAERLAALARRRGLPLRDFDDGYLSHCVMRELWQERAPTPFVLRGRGHAVDVWGYSRTDAAALVEHARAFGDPSLVAAIAGLEGVASKAMPRFEQGRRVGFLLRACPVVRLAGPTSGHSAGAEVDAFLARCFSAGKQTHVSREEVYRDWLTRRLGHQPTTGVRVERIRIAGMSRERLLRRGHGEQRTASRLERPDVRFEGDLVVDDGDRFLACLAHGVGRHRAFGFGALILVPPGTSHSV
jgi:CRISPR system Cascade subunit CasE